MEHQNENVKTIRGGTDGEGRTMRQNRGQPYIIHQDAQRILVWPGIFQLALDQTDTDIHSIRMQRLLLEEMLVLAEQTSPVEMGIEFREVLLCLMSSDRVMNLLRREDILDTIVRVYFPRFAREFWETFMVQEKERTGKIQFLTEVVSAVKRRLLTELLCLGKYKEHNHLDVLKERRKAFGQLFLTAVKPLSCDSVSGCPYESSDGGEETSLFSRAVSLNLLNEAVLLYDTGSVCPRELAALAGDTKVKEMLRGSDSSPMARYLRQVVFQPLSLQARCRSVLAASLGEDLKGKLDRTRSLGLPTSVCESLVNLHQTKQYMKSVNKDDTDSVDGEETDSMETDTDQDDFQALNQLIHF